MQQTTIPERESLKREWELIEAAVSALEVSKDQADQRIVQLTKPSTWTPTIDPELARQLHAEVIKKFSDIFGDDAKWTHKERPVDAPYHLIHLKGPRKSINGRIFALPEKYMN